MKSILFVILALSSVHAAATDWKRYHVDQQQGIEMFLDLDSLQQAPEAFSADVRMTASHSKQVFLVRQTVNCLTATYTLSNMRELGKDGNRMADDETGSIDPDTALESLRELYCARWQEPAGVRWKAFATAPGETFFYDERVEQMLDVAGIQDGFKVSLKTLGEEKSLLAEARISCRNNSFDILSGTYRDETRGWLANAAPSASRTPASGSFIANLMSFLCQPTGGDR